MKPKILALFLAVGSCFLLGGCAQNSDDGASTTMESRVTTVQTEEKSTMNEIEKKDPELPWILTEQANGLSVRTVDIDIPGNGDVIEILQISDVHFNVINDEDRAENNELVIYSSKDLTWPKKNVSESNLQRCLEYGANMDQIVITGDVLSYLSKGNIEKLHQLIWEPYPEALVCAGNHDPLRSWNAAADESATLDERISILEAAWKHDLYYTSKVLDERVMVIQMDNATRYDYGDPGFWERQVEPLRNDLALAREKGYTVLLFYHVPLATGNPKNHNTAPLGSHGVNFNFYTKGIGNYATTGASAEIYEMITNNADIIAATFCGHRHGDYYTEINAKTADGTEKVIPQYVLTAMPYEKGHVIHIKLS